MTASAERDLPLFVAKRITDSVALSCCSIRAETGTLFRLNFKAKVTSQQHKSTKLTRIEATVSLYFHKLQQVVRGEVPCLDHMAFLASWVAQAQGLYKPELPLYIADKEGTVCSECQEIATALLTTENSKIVRNETTVTMDCGDTTIVLFVRELERIQAGKSYVFDDQAVRQIRKLLTPTPRA